MKRKALRGEGLVNQQPQTALHYLLLTTQPDGMPARAAFDVIRESSARALLTAVEGLVHRLSVVVMLSTDLSVGINEGRSVSG